MFISWTDTERRRIALDVAAGRLDYRIARALLDGYIYLGQSDWANRREILEGPVRTTYREVCSLLSIPLVEVYNWYEHSAPSRNQYRAEVYCSLSHLDWTLTETAIFHLKEVAKSLQGTTDSLEMLTELGADSFTVEFNETFGSETGLPSESAAEDFTKELLHVLTSTVFRKAG